MSCNITNYIQNTWTESDNMVIFVTNIRTHFRYIYYLDIFRFVYIRIVLIQIQRRTQLKTHT